MARSSRQQHQLNLPAVEVRNSEHATPAFRKTEHASEKAGKPEQTDGAALASVLFDEALKDARMSSQEVAFLLSKTGPPVSESLVQKWRKPTERACPSLAQVLRLPPQFHLAMIRQLDAQFGLGQRVLAQVQQAVGTLGLLVR